MAFKLFESIINLSSSTKTCGVDVKDNGVFNNIIPYAFFATALDLLTVGEKGSFTISNINP